MWAKATFPAVLFRQCSGIFFKPAWQCFLHCGWALENRLYLFIYLYLLRLVWPSVLGCFSETPRFTHFQLHTFTPLGAKVSPTVVHRAFLLDQPGVNCLAQGHFHKSYLGMHWLFLFALPSCSQLRDLKKLPFSQKPNSLRSPLTAGAEIGRQRKAFWASFNFTFALTEWPVHRAQ